MLYDKILGSLVAAACGDAMGAATENLPMDGILENFGGPVRGFLKPPATAFATGSEAGQVTDDFSITYLLARNIVAAQGKVDRPLVERTLVDWSRLPQYFERFAGPSTRAAVLALQGQPQPKRNIPVDNAAKATNGAAMKISPAGLIHPGDLDAAIEDAVTITMVTHDNHLAISGACAVAAAVSRALQPGVSLYDVVQAGFYGARRGEEIGRQRAHFVGGPSVRRRMDMAVAIGLGSGSLEDKMRDLADLVGSGLHISEAVPTAFGLLVAAGGDVMETVWAGVNIGYDTDTVATIAGSMAGALGGMSAIKGGEEYLAILDRMNDMDIGELAQGLAAIGEARL